MYPGNQIYNNIERSIHKLKNHFIALIFSVDTDFHLQLWERILQQAKISLTSRLHSHLSAYAHLYGEFDYNYTTLSPPGTKVVIHNRPGDRAYWQPHGEPGWYIEPSTGHYRCHKAYIPQKRAERISDTVEFYS